MIIKQPDEKKSQIAALQALQARPDASVETRKRIEQEIRNIQAGMKGEAEAAYEMDFHFGPSNNHAVIHDLRIECDGRVAQIDHLVINRFLCIWVCESKHFSEGIAINAHGECSAFYGGRPYGVASPFEQNRKHIMVLNSIFKAGMAKLPTRLGFAIKPTMISVVLISKNARISRPKTKIDGLDSIIKNDQFRSFVDRAVDGDNNPLTLAKLIGQDTLESFALSVTALHTPITFNWAAKFGLSEAPPSGNLSVTNAPSQAPLYSTIPAAEVAAVVKEYSKPKQKLICTKCSEPVAFNVARFCWFNKTRFGGSVYCMECQKTV
jgi:hypothetical protein